jgi:protein SCO1
MKTVFVSLFAAAALIVTLESIAPLKKKYESKHKATRAALLSEKNHDHMCCVMDGADSSALPGNSVYQLGSSWKNQDGKIVNISDLRGRIVIIAMFYSHCTYACPLTINDMKRVEASLPKNIKGKVRFVLVSFDPKRDTPETLKALANGQQLSVDSTQGGGDDWTLLTGRVSDIRSLAAVLGVLFKKKPDGDFLHSSQIAVLDRQGEIVYKHFGLNKPINDVAAAVERCSRQD